MPLTELMPAALVIDTANLRISFVHPCRHGTGGGCQDDIVVFFAQHFDDFVQFVEIVFLLRGLDLCPGKYIDSCTVDTGILEVCHILLPYFLRPLVGVIVAAIENSSEGFVHI